MATTYDELLVCGYIREYFTLQNMELPPKDLVLLFAAWVALVDTFDATKSHKSIYFDSDTKIMKQSGGSHFATAIGSCIVGKGDKRSWSFKFTVPMSIACGVVGVIDNEAVNEVNSYNDYTNKDECENSYGLGLRNLTKYQTTHYDDKWFEKFHYPGQFLFDGDCRLFTMELDMTQKENKNGIVRYIFHHKSKDGVDEIKTDGKYSNIAWNSININKQYRMAFAITDYASGKWVEILPTMPS